jgi:hypothetical protein
MPPTATFTLTPTPSPAIPIRGVGNFRYDLSPELAKELKDMGVNWIQLILWVQVTDDGKLIPFWDSLYGPSDVARYSGVEGVIRESQRTEEVMVQRIKEAHENGFKVFLCTYHERIGAHHEYGRGLKVDVDSLLRQAKEIALKWARIAEENGVEMFAPRKELQMLVGDRKALEWDDEILPELRKVYHGSLVRGAFSLYNWSKGKFVIPAEELPADMSGWDYLGVDLYGNRVNTFEEWAAYVKRFALKVQELKEKHGLKGAVFEELGYPHLGEEAFWQDKSLTGDEVLQRLYQIVFEASAGAVEGFFPWVWREGKQDLPAGRREYVSPNEVIKNYYTARIIPESKVNPAREYVPPEVTIRATKVLLEDDFEGAVTRLSGYNFTVANGFLRLQRGALSAEGLSLMDVVFKGRFKILSGTVGIGFRDSDVGRYEVRIHPISLVQLLKPMHGKGAPEVLRDVHALVEYDRWHTFTILAKGEAIQVFIDGTRILDYVDPIPLPEGSVCIHAEDADIMFDDLVVEKIIE